MRSWSLLSARTFPAWVRPQTSISSSYGLRRGPARVGLVVAIPESAAESPFPPASLPFYARPPDRPDAHPPHLLTALTP